jgi:hypothetical protein
VSRYRAKGTRLYFRGDAAFASPDIYEFLEVEGMGYAIRLSANRVLQEKIGHLLNRPMGRRPHEVRRYHASFSYQAQSWKKPRRVVASVTNLVRPAEQVVTFYNQRGTAEQWIKEGKAAIRWPRLSCRSFAANAVRLQLHALAYNLGNFMRTLALPAAAEPWSLTSLREKLIKIGAKVVSLSRSRWPRSWYRGGCSRTSSRSSRGCGRRLHQHDAFRDDPRKRRTGKVRLDESPTAFTAMDEGEPERIGRPDFARAAALPCRRSWSSASCLGQTRLSGGCRIT